jgi:hypothetical protein
MHEPPEIAYETVTPDVLVKRLDMLRESLRTGMMSVGAFNTAIKAFQFKDEVGHLWAPGATTSQWYRWDLDRWTAADPPAKLLVDQSPILFDDFEEATTPPAARPEAVICASCGSKNVGKKFCTACGKKLTA